MGLLRVRTVAAGNAIMVLTGAALLGLFYFLSPYEQVILHYGAITAGLSQLPFALALIAAAAAPLIARRGSKTVLSAGLVLLAGGLVWFGRNHNGLSINGQATWPPNLVPLIYPGAGIGITIS